MVALLLAVGRRPAGFAFGVVGAYAARLAALYRTTRRRRLACRDLAWLDRRSLQDIGLTEAQAAFESRWRFWWP